MTNPERADRISGQTIQLHWTDGPTKGQTHEHVFHKDGTVEWHAVDAKPKPVADGKEKKKAPERVPYAAVQVTDTVAVVSYKSGADFTLTSVLNFDDRRVTGFASGGKDWFPVAGTFEVLG
jgi:MoaF N-terminal domain